MKYIRNAKSEYEMNSIPREIIGNDPIVLGGVIIVKFSFLMDN